MNTPTPRTDRQFVVLLGKTWIASYYEMHEHARTLERELAAERARLDWLNLRAPTCWSLIDAQMLAGKTETICAAIDAAMKEGAK